VSSELAIDPEVLVKIDVQGFEDRVLAGGRGLLGRTALAIVEVNHEAMYEGQPSFEHIYQVMAELGFQFHGTWHQLFSRRSGAVLSSDVIFARR
jgi:hypothetical protein